VYPLIPARRSMKVDRAIRLDASECALQIADLNQVLARGRLIRVADPAFHL
jgi:hypothetical protein